MQQSVLIAAVRGPDGIRKDHVTKLLLRWFRRCIMISAFERRVLLNPIEACGGSFTGPSLSLGIGITEHARDWRPEMTAMVKQYLSTVDELPHHFQLHFMHAAEIIGYKHPDGKISNWWWQTYQSLVNDMHLYPETAHQMDKRLGDYEEDWRAREEVMAAGPQ